MTYLVFVAIILLFIAFIAGWLVGLNLRRRQPDMAGAGSAAASAAPASALANTKAAAETPSHQTSDLPTSGSSTIVERAAAASGSRGAAEASNATADNAPPSTASTSASQGDAAPAAPVTHAMGAVAVPASTEATQASESAAAAATPAAEEPQASSAPELSGEDAEMAREADSAGKRPAGLQAPRGGQPDKLTRVKGIGPVNEERLHRLGIFHFDQIAAWGGEEIAWVDTFLTFKGRIERENWVSQAAELAKE